MISLIENCLSVPVPLALPFPSRFLPEIGIEPRLLVLLGAFVGRDRK
jgi:hypothetical protein